MTLLQASVPPKLLFFRFVGDGALKLTGQLIRCALLPTSKCFLEKKKKNAQSNVIGSAKILLNVQKAKPQTATLQDFTDEGLL